MPMATATRERLTSAAITLHHPLDHYFGVFLRAKEAEGLKPRTLNDHKNHYRTCNAGWPNSTRRSSWMN